MAYSLLFGCVNSLFCASAFSAAMPRLLSLALIFSNFSASHSAPPFISLSSLVSVPKLGERFTCGKIRPYSWLCAAYSPHIPPPKIHCIYMETSCRDNFRRVRFISDWPNTIGNSSATFTIAKMIRHDVTMAVSKMAAHSRLQNLWLTDLQVKTESCLSQKRKQKKAKTR